MQTLSEGIPVLRCSDILHEAHIQTFAFNHSNDRG